MWQRFTTVDMSKLQVVLHAALDLRDPGVVGLVTTDLIGDDYSITQAIGAAAFDHGLEAVLVPTATAMRELGAAFNVVILTDNLQSGSSIVAIETRSPNIPP